MAELDLDFVLEKSFSRHGSAEFRSPLETMTSNNLTTPAMMQALSPANPSGHLSPTGNLPPFSQFTLTCSTFEGAYPNAQVLDHRNMVDDMERQDSRHLVDLNGNISEGYNTMLESQHYHHQEHDYEEEQTAVQSSYCGCMGQYSNGMSSCAMHCSSPTSVYDHHYYSTGYTSQTSFDSDDSFEVEYTDQDVSCDYQRTQDFGQLYLNTQHNNIVNRAHSLPNFAEFSHNKKPPNRRGRPVTYNKPGYHFSDSDSLISDEDDRAAQSKGCRRGAKNILLWKFLLGELRKPSSHYIKWENEKEGIFKFVDTAEISKLWGQMKKKEDMNFEKLSRGIRHYYKDGLMSRRDGIRLVYKFNWDRVPKAYWPRMR